MILEPKIGDYVKYQGYDHGHNDPTCITFNAAIGYIGRVVRSRTVVHEEYGLLYKVVWLDTGRVSLCWAKELIILTGQELQDAVDRHMLLLISGKGEELYLCSK